MIENNTNITRLCVNFFLVIFTIVTILIVLLLILYYLTPNNYIVKSPNISILDSEYKLVNDITLTAKPNSKTSLDYSAHPKDFMCFDSDINLIVKNSFKSQNLSLVKGNLIQIRYNSDIYITNFTEKDISLKVSFYSKKE